MGLTLILHRCAARRAHVLVVEGSRSWLVRTAVERELLRRGWRLAESPADADVLAVCGDAGPEMAEVAERLWDQLPGPRVRVDIAETTAVALALDSAAARLADPHSHRHDAATRSLRPVPEGGHGDQAEHEMDHGEMDHGDMDHGDMAPAGIPLAEGGADRDGLELDELHLRLGPVLAHWPAGLVLRCALQGDVVTQAHAERVDAGHGPTAAAADRAPEPAVLSAALRCDNASHLLALAGWTNAALAARNVRDSLLTGTDGPTAAAAIEALGRRVRRSHPLRWSLRGVGRLGADDLAQHDLPEHLGGDTHERLVSMIERAQAELDDTRQASGWRSPSTRAALAALPHLVTGLDLATARLVVASLDLDPMSGGREVSHA